jgi:adenine phosphoribosyltransferase
MVESTSLITERLASAIRDVPDFPKPGILFKDITPVLEDPVLCADLIEEFAQRCAGMGIQAIAGVESRGFLFGVPLAIRLGVPFITVRKKGKLPYKTVSYSYDLEYGSAEIEMHQDSVKPGWKVLIHYDLLATGGTAAATAELVKSQGAEIAGFAFLVELAFLDGRKQLEQYKAEVVDLVSF